VVCTVKPTIHVAHAAMKASMGGLRCETDNPRGPRSHEGEPIVGTDRRTFFYLDCDLMTRLYTSIVRSHLGVYKYCMASLLEKRH